MFNQILIEQTTRIINTTNSSFTITSIKKEININQAKIFEHTARYITFEFPYQYSRQRFAESLKAMGYEYELDGDHYLIMYI